MTDTGGELIYLLEMDVYNPSTNAVEQLFACTGKGYTTGPLDIYPNRPYQPRLGLPADIRRYVFDDGKTGGASVTDLGTIRLANIDAYYDYLEEDGYSVDGRNARILVGYQSWPRSLFKTILVATMESMEMVLRAENEDTYEGYCDIRFLDPLTIFDKPIQSNKFAGTNVGPVGVEGTGDDLKGAPKPRSWGTVFNVSAPMVNTSELICQVNDGIVGGIPNVYDNAVALINDGDVTTLSALLAWSPASGRYKTCVALGLFRLGANPAGTITADVVQVGTASSAPGGEAVQFDGTGHVLYNTGFANITDDAIGLLFSGWFRIDGGNGTVRTLFAGHNGVSGGYFGVRMWLDTSNRVNVEVRDSTGGSVLSFRGNTGYSAGSTWRHIAWDAYLYTPAASMTCSLAIDGALVATTVSKSGPGGKIDITLNRWSIAGKYAPGSGYTETAAISAAELWFDRSWVNLTVAPSVITLFRTSDGYPADLGTNGQAVSGSPPIMYLRGSTSAFRANYGSGGAFVETGGTLAVADSSPYRPATVITSAVVPVGEIARDIVKNISGVADADFDYQRIARFEADAPQGVGIYVDEERNVREVLDDLYNSVAGWYGFTRERKFVSGKLQLPLDEPVLSITGYDILSIESTFTSDADRGVPAYAVTVDYAKNYTVQTDGVSGSISVERRAWLAQEFRRPEPAAENAVLGAHPRATEIPFETLMTTEADARAFAIDRLAVYSRRRQRLRVQVKLTPGTVEVELGDTVDVTYQRFGLQRGRRFMVIGIGFLTQNDRIELDLWGGEPLPPTAGMLAWVRGDTVTLGDGKVAAMRDRTGRSNDWVNAGPLRPSPVADIPEINYQAAVEFDETDWLQSTNGLTFTADDAKTVYAVFKPTGFRLNNGTLYLNAALVHDISGTGTWGIYLRSAAPRAIGLVNDGSVKSVTQAATQGEWMVLEFVHDGNGIEMRRHDVVVPGRASAGGAQTLFAWAIGLNTATALDAQVAEIIAYDGVLTQVQRERVRAYIKARYGIGFTPDGPPIGPRMWLRGDSVTESAGAVTAWLDKTGLGRNFEQATGANRPTYHATDATINDQPCVEFDGSNDFLSAVATMNLGKLISQSTFTFYVVAKADTTGANEGIFSAGGILDVLIGVSSNKIIVSHDDGSADSLNVAISTGTWAIIEARHEGGRLYLRSLDVDEQAVASASTSNMAAAMEIGRKSTAYFDGRIAEILFYDAALSTADRQAVRDYLAARYGLTWTVFPTVGAADLIGAGGMAVVASVVLAAPVSGMSAWYRSSDLLGSMSGDYVDISTVPDQSGNARNLTAGIWLATSAAGGTMDLAFGYPEILCDDDFDGAESSAVASSWISGTAYTIYGVAKIAANARYGDTLLELGGNDGGTLTGELQVFVDPNTNPPSLVVRDMTNEARVAAPGWDTWFAFEIVKTGGRVRIATHAGSYGYVAAGTTTVSQNGLALGRRHDTASPQGFRGSIAEIITYSSALSSGDQATARRYFTDRYGFTWAAEPDAALAGAGAIAATPRLRGDGRAVLPGTGGVAAIGSSPVKWSASATLGGRGGMIPNMGTQLPTATGWWAADRATLDVGGYSLWTDKSGNGRNMRQTSADFRPAVAAAQLNGRDVADFIWVDDGVDFPFRQFTGSSSFATSVITTTAGTVYVVFKARSAYYNQAAGSRQSNNLIYRLGNTYLTLSSAGVLRPVYRLSTTNYETAHTISFGTWYMLEIRHDGTNLISRLSDSAAEQSVAVASWTSNTTTLIGGSGSQGFDGELAEMITFNTALGTNDRQAVRDYLSTKYGLSWA